MLALLIRYRAASALVCALCLAAGGCARPGPGYQSPPAPANAPSSPVNRPSSAGEPPSAGARPPPEDHTAGAGALPYAPVPKQRREYGGQHDQLIRHHDRLNRELRHAHEGLHERLRHEQYEELRQEHEQLGQPQRGGILPEAWHQTPMEHLQERGHGHESY